MKPITRRQLMVRVLGGIILGAGAGKAMASLTDSDKTQDRLENEAPRRYPCLPEHGDIVKW
jgi:hypothetical protein